jgi:hypothetical protein
MPSIWLSRPAEQVVSPPLRVGQAAPASLDLNTGPVRVGDADITDAWLAAIGGLGPLKWVHDPDRQLYGQWGLGFARLAHFGGLPSLLGVVRLWFQGIHNRGATGTRWQRAGVFLVRDGRVAWLHVPASAQAFELPPDHSFQGHLPQGAQT